MGTGCLLLAAPNGQSSVPQVAQCPSCGLATCIYSPDETQRPVLAQGSGTPSQAMSHVSLVFTPGVLSGSKSALPLKSSLVSFLTMGLVSVPGPMQTWEEGSIYQTFTQRNQSCCCGLTHAEGEGGQAALRRVNMEGGLSDGGTRLPIPL